MRRRGARGAGRAEISFGWRFWKEQTSSLVPIAPTGLSGGAYRFGLLAVGIDDLDQCFLGRGDFIDLPLCVVLGHGRSVDDGLRLEFHDDLSASDLQFQEVGFVLGDDRTLEDFKALQRTEFHLLLTQ